MRRGALGIVAVGLAASLSARAFDERGRQQIPVFRGGVELVQVDAVVLDEKTSQPVHGLTASDFTVLDRKKPQPIATFSEVNYDHDPAQPSLPPDLPLDVADNRTVRATRVVLVVVDDLHIAQSLTETTRDLVRRLLRDLGPQATVGLTFTSGRRGVELTEDRALVYNEIETFRGQRRQIGPAPGPRRGNGCSVGGSSELASPDFWDANRLHKALTDAARVLGTETLRRKAFVLVSEGIAADISGLFETMRERPQEICRDSFSGPTGITDAAYTDDDLLRMMDAMRRANVATYVINPESAGRIVDRGGLGDVNLMAGDSGPQLNTLMNWNRPSVMAKDYLSQLAYASGGFAVTDSNSLESGLALLLEDLDHYYMLGIRPVSTDKNWHDLEVRVNRPGVVVRNRRGYRIGSETPPPKNAREPLAGPAANVLPLTDLPLKMFITPLPSAGRKQTRLGVTMQIRADRAAMTDADGELRDTLHMLTMAVNLDTRKLTKTSIKRERQVLLRPRPGALLRDEIVYQIVSEWEAPPGRYQFRTTVQSDKMQKSGAVYLVADVPDFNKAVVALSGLVIGFADSERHSVDGTAIEHQLMPLEPMLERVLAPTDSLRIDYDVWRKNPSDQASTQLEIYDDAHHFVRTAAHDVPVAGAGHVDVTVPLTGLAPGPYVLRVSASDQATVVTREIGFFIR